MVYEQYVSNVNVLITDMGHTVYHYLVAEGKIDSYFIIPINPSEGKVLHFSLSLTDRERVPQRSEFGSFARPPPPHIEYNGTTYKLILRNETELRIYDPTVANVQLSLVEPFDMSNLSWETKPKKIADISVLDVEGLETRGSSGWSIDITKYVTGEPPVEPPYVPPIEPPVEPPVEPPIDPPIEPPITPPIVPPSEPPEKGINIMVPLVIGTGLLYALARRK